MTAFKIYKLLNIVCLTFLQVINTFSDNLSYTPLIKSYKGELLIRSVPYRNITFRTKGESGLFVNSVSILKLVQSKKDEQLSPIEEKEKALTTQNIQTLLDSLKEDLLVLNSQFATLQNRTLGRRQIMNIRRNLGRIQQALSREMQIESNLMVNECQEVGGTGIRCKNGGTCYDGYKDFHCECPNGWRGKTCEDDVDECYLLAGTDLGCQNNGDCINTLGSYRCSCHNGFYGTHCRQRNATCDHTSRGELCGNGICVYANNVAGISCICDQGWTKNLVDPEAACNIDINECDESINPCHGECINLPGSFKCGQCPSGYTGNGVFCIDVDECAVSNGGCSMHPKVSCENSEGSYHCGDCPAGWEGDGKVCESTASVNCELKNICFPTAKCEYISNTVVCTCPIGMYGHGFGADGCSLLPLTNLCANHTCQNNSTCEILGSGTRCICANGFMGPACQQIDACHSNPCRNGGTCHLLTNNTYQCTCPSGITGVNCEHIRSICGSTIIDKMGSITYPPDGGSYLPNERCVFLIRTDDPLILNITFSRFDLERSDQCQKDWLQLHDGHSLASRLIGQFCGNSLPLGGNIQTSQKYLFVWFRSDNETNGAGFNITWNSVEHTCGKRMDLGINSNGIIRSAGYPGKTPPNKECEWYLNAPFGYRLKLRFFDINLGSSSDDNCTRDSLKIFDSDQLLKSICEPSLTEPLHSSSNIIHINLKTDNSGADCSFQLHYEVVPSDPRCGGVFTEASGIINGYVNGHICLYLIQQPIDTKIKLEFKHFEPLHFDSCSRQNIEIFDGGSDESNLLKRICGNQNELYSIISSHNIILIRSINLLERLYLPFIEISYKRDFSISTHESHPALGSETTSSGHNETFVDIYLSKNVKHRYYEGIFLHLVSEKNVMQIIFHGGSNKERSRGIRVEYSFEMYNCGGILTKEIGNFSHREIVGPLKQNCEWVIETSKGKHIQLDLRFFRWINFDCTQGDKDVSIYSNDTSAEGQLLVSFCGNAKTIREDFYASTLTIILHMNRNSKALVQINVNYEVIDNTKVCGGNFSARYGIVKTPHWPKAYDDLMNCTWTISAPIGHKIELRIQNFSLETSSNFCENDFLEIRNGNNIKSPLIGKYCGTSIPPRVPSFTNHLYLHFVSDSYITNTGFFITWEQTETGCGGKLDSHKGSIHSPNNLDVSTGSIVCDWQIIVSQGSTILINITSLENDMCNQNMLTAYDGLTVNSPKIKFDCDINKNSVQLKTSSYQALIIYNYDRKVDDGLQFFIDYKTECTVKLDNLQGVIESPNFPDNYPPDMNCFWDVQGANNNKFQLIFSHLNIEIRDTACDYDYIDIFDLQNDDVLSKLRLCSNPRKAITTEGNRFQIKFVTDYSDHAQGFRLEYKRLDCGGYLRENRGVITTRDAPYSINLNCDWYIEVEAGKVIILTFNTIHIESERGDCNDDGIFVSDEKNSSIYLLKECRTDQVYATVTSPANYLYIHFHTSNTRLKKYFDAVYETRDAFCGGKFHGNSGQITYPLYGHHSGISTECIWTITVEDSYGINLIFESFNTSCNDTYLSFSNGISSSSLDKFCGNKLPANKFIQGNALKVVYKASAVGWGNFSFKFKKACGGLLSNSVGYIKTKPDEQCEWKIESQGTKIFLNILHFECDCSKKEKCTNGLQLVDGNAKNELNKFCDNHQSNIVLLTNSLIIYASNIDLKAKYSIAHSSCGGEITSMRGILTSPYYPQPYPPSVECIWEIKATAGSSIVLNIEELDIQKSDDCNQDYLEIRQSDENGKIIHIFCSNKTDIEYMTVFQKAWIKFRSVEGSTGNGFKINWNYAHNIELNSTTGSIESPPLTSIYSQEAFTWRILLPRGNYIYMDFEEYTKGLRLYDGFDETALEVLISESPFQYTSSSNVLYLVSINNEMETFKINWRTVNESIVQTNMFRSDCNKILVLNHMDRMNISSLGYPNGYANDMDCEWILKPLDPTEHILLSLYEVKLEPNGESDYLRVMSSANLRDWKKELDISDSSDISLFPIKVIHGTPYLRMEFHTDSSFNRTGFTSLARTVCGSNMTGLIGQITLRNYMRSWSSNQVCKWQIEVPMSKKISLHFNYYNKTLPKSQVCERYAVIYDGFDSNAPILPPGHICNKEKHNVKTMESSTNRIVIIYNFNGTNSFEGDFDFNITYQEIGDCDTEIQLTDYLNSINISSPSYPNVPNPHTECSWIIIGPVGETLKVEFVDKFSMNTRYCDKEYVELFDGSTELSHSFGRFCTRPSIIRSTGNIILVHYLSDINEPRNGFRANVSISKCGGTFTGGNGVIRSIGYPTIGAYPKPAVCEYTIQMPENARMRLNFSDLDLPYESDRFNRSDRIEIFSINNTPETISVLYGNTSSLPFIDINANLVRIRFITFTGNRLHRGFKLDFKRLYDDCSREVDNDSGLFSYNSDGKFSGFVRCRWIISVPKGQRVTFEFLKLEGNITGSFSRRAYPYRGEQTSKISFYNDPDLISAITEVNLNTISFPEKIQSSDNFMLVRIVSNHLFLSIKARYSSNDESSCPPDLNEQDSGSIEINGLQFKDYFYCASKYILNGAETITFRINELSITKNNSLNTLNTYAVRFKGESFLIVSHNLITNSTNQTISFTSSGGIVSIVQNEYVKINRLSINFYRSSCGGRFNLLIDDIKIIFPSENFLHDGIHHSIECRWLFTGASVNKPFKLVGNVSLINDCKKEYIGIYAGGSRQPSLIAKICHNSTELTFGIDLKQYLTTILYHSHESNTRSSSSFEIVAEPSAACGNKFNVQTHPQTVSVNSKTYKNNMECSWEFKTYEGYFMSVTFSDRFFIEKSANCSKDYLEIYANEKEIWQPKHRFCGRNIPSIYNATSKRILMVFRTDGAITADGFTFRVSADCKATFNVTEELQSTQTPPFLNFRRYRTQCTYTFVTDSDKSINLQVKPIHPTEVRRFDSFTVYKRNNYGNEFEGDKFTGEAEISEHQYLRLVFRVSTQIFLISYQLNTCGGNISQSTIIRSLMATYSESDGNNVYANNMNCVWNVMAPLDHSVLVRFKLFDMEEHYKCNYDFVSIYIGSSPRTESLVDKLCGDLSKKPPLISVDSNRALIVAVSDNSHARRGFLAEIIFVRNCNERISLTREESIITQPFIMIRNYTLSSNEELHCNIHVTAPEGHRISIHMRDLDINHSQCLYANCDGCNYVEISESVDQSVKEMSIGKYCSNNEINRKLITSDEHALLQFSFTIVGNYTIEIVLDIEKSNCGGHKELELKHDKDITIVFPSDLQTYPANTHCKWRIKSDISYRIHFEYFLLQKPSAESGKCVDFLRISYDTTVKDYCGNATGFTYLRNVIRNSKYTELTFHSDDSFADRGFNIQISSQQACNYTHTKLSESIQFEQREYGNETCYQDIKVPDNYLINVHIRLSKQNHADAKCSHPDVEVYDIASNKTLWSRCIRFFFESQIQTNTSAIRIYTRSLDKLSMDYFTSPGFAGEGCGGDIYALKGAISSPDYTNRNFSECRWVITMPAPNHVEIYFTMFDMGSMVNCEFDYVQITEISGPGQENLAHRFCGEQYIERFKSKTNKIAIVSKKSPNFNGLGWALRYGMSN